MPPEEIPIEKQVQPESRAGNRRWIKVLVLLLIGGAIATGWMLAGEALSLEQLAAREDLLREYRQRRPELVYGAAFFIYVLATGLSLPGAAVLTLIYGWSFGFWRGLVLVSFASTAGATLAFTLSRYLLRDALQRRFGDRLTRFNAALEREGALYLFTLRLIPAVPFFVINVVMGLTPLRTWTFWWVSQLGMLAGTAVYVSAGASFPDLKTLSERGAEGLLTPRLVASFALLSAFPFVVKFAMRKLKPAG